MRLSLKSWRDYEKIEKDKMPLDGTVIGVGVTAFMRFFIGLFVPRLVIACLKDSTDNELIKEYAEVFCLQKRRPGIKLEFTNTHNILLNLSVRTYVQKLPKPRHLFVYRMNRNISRAIRGLGVKKVIAATPIQNKMYEDKVRFRRALDRIGVEPIPGRVMTFRQFSRMSFVALKNEFGLPFVIQLPDFTLGGGKGTIFIRSGEDLVRFSNESEGGVYKNKELKRALVMRYITGTSASVTCVATRYGTFVSTIHRQLIDVPEVINTSKGSGLFVGHVFGETFSPKVQRQARELAKKFGSHMYKHGFKGIFGMDLIVNEKEGRVYPVECNARYTGAFPMISMLHRDNKIIPMDIFHLLEYIGMPYRTDTKVLDMMYAKPVKGSHIIFSNKRDHSVEVKRGMRAGLYSYNAKTGKIRFEKPTLWYSDIKKNNQFIITDGTPKEGQEIFAYNRAARVSHLLFKGSIADKKGRLKPTYAKTIRGIYKHLFGANY